MTTTFSERHRRICSSRKAASREAASGDRRRVSAMARKTRAAASWTATQDRYSKSTSLGVRSAKNLSISPATTEAGLFFSVGGAWKFPMSGVLSVPRRAATGLAGTASFCRRAST
jgi:hypothetical protein